MFLLDKQIILLYYFLKQFLKYFELTHNDNDRQHTFSDNQFCLNLTNIFVLFFECLQLKVDEFL